MSERSDLAGRLATIIVEGRMCNPFGGEVTRSADKRSYQVLFAKPRVLDGLVTVYSAKFILIQTDGPMAQLNAVYESEEAATAVLRALVACEVSKAYAVPTRAPRAAKGR
jgi:hypothetical protein